MNSISLAQFRAQIGIQNYGNVIATNDGKVKTVNNGIFARNFKVFQKSISQNQAITTATLLYNAIKGEVGKSDPSKTFLESIAKELGVTDDGTSVDGDENTKKLDRRQLKTVIMKVDAFRSMIRKGLPDALNKVVVGNAHIAFGALQKNFGANAAVKELLDKYNGGFLDKVEKEADPKKGTEAKLKYKNHKAAIPFLKALFELKDANGKLIIKDETFNKSFADTDYNWLKKTKDSIEDCENLDKLDVTLYDNLDDLLNDLQEGSKDGKVLPLKSPAATSYLRSSLIGINILNKIKSDKRILRSFLDALNSQLTKNGKDHFKNEGFRSKLSDEELMRVIQRQISRIISKVGNISESNLKFLTDYHSTKVNTPIDNYDNLAGYFADVMSKNDFIALFGDRTAGH